MSNAAIERFRLPVISDLRLFRRPHPLEVALVCTVLRCIIEMNDFH